MMLMEPIGSNSAGFWMRLEKVRTSQQQAAPRWKPPVAVVVAGNGVVAGPNRGHTMKKKAALGAAFFLD